MRINSKVKPSLENAFIYSFVDTTTILKFYYLELYQKLLTQFYN